ncbi:glutamyl-tRNA amidotransferase [Rhodospirillum rubrum]|uniref:GatB/YqeY domain-containing protein n=1 Tax=Rhodospirillum rubrum TaxID=1085 RepID=UPI001903F0B3|nr:GatB/YqeY domain-containing protein [Rhodospirillum rubrum]MBK1663858.1 glutamyl-tRNA amidotransferase [Rhodospirillum rubrum]MBK1675898.1 glutamyl-tRNA amidotransferase [Rhodospirillum rubrum]
MLRAQLNDAMKAAMRAKDQRALSTVRLILAALKDRDICARGKGNMEGIADEEVLQMLQSMIKQRRESISMYEQGGRLELAQQEQEEIEVIERFLPAQMDEAAMAAAVEATITALDAQGIKDMGRVMAALKDRFGGQMDFARAGALAKAKLTN